MPEQLKLLNPGAVRDLLTPLPLGGVNGIDSEALAVELAPAQSFAGEALTASVRTGFSIRAFNSPDDEDEDGVVGAPPLEATEVDFSPHLEVDASTAYLKYRGEVALKAKVTGTPLRELGFELDGEAALVLSDYRRHPPSAPTRDTVFGDILALRCTLRLADVLALGEREAVAQQMAGRVSATLEFAWSDVISASAGRLTSLIGAAGPVGVRTSAGATLTVRVSFADDFVLVFSREAADSWRIGLRKARTRAVHLGLALGVKVEVDAGRLDALLKETFVELVGVDRGVVDKLLGKLSVDKLKAAERAVFTTVAKRLGLDPDNATIERVRERVDRLSAGLEQALAVTIQGKVEAGFVHDYRRIKQTTTILQCLVTKAGMTKHHAAVVRGQFAELLREAESSSAAVRLEHLLYHNSIKTERSWGISLSLGKWATGSRDTKTLERIEQVSVGRAQRRHAYVGERSYEDKDERARQWSVVFSADMPAFVSDAVPRVSAFDIGISLVWHESKAKLDAKTLGRWLDHAVLWGALDESRAEEARERCKEALKTKALGVLQLTVPAPVFDIVLAEAAGRGAGSLASALAAAMPWNGDDPFGQIASGRRRVYEALWQQFLEHDGSLPGREWSRLAVDHLRGQGAGTLANLERFYSQASANPASTFGGLIDLNPDTRRQCQAFAAGLQRLHEKRSSGAPDAGVIPQVFEQLEDLWAQSLHVRATGKYLLDIARSAGATAGTTRSFTLTMGTDGGTLVFAG